MSLQKFAALLVCFGLVGGCASVPNIETSEQFWQEKNAKIGIVLDQVPKASAHKMGSQGLLDMAISNAVSGTLETHLNGLEIETKLNALKEKVAAYLTAQGYSVEVISSTIEIAKLDDFVAPEQTKGVVYAKKDFTKLKTQLNIDKLMVISPTAIGTIRSYYGFIPTSAPTGYAKLNGQIVNLNTNVMEWNQLTEQSVPTRDGVWDVPPQYPSLTEAVFASITQSNDALFNKLAR